MNINWYPGHMAKTKREISENIKLIDVVIEILDARIPISSQNPDIKEIIKNKKKIILLNKWDLADEKETGKWQEYFKKQGIETLAVNCNDGKGINQVVDKIEKVMEEEKKLQAERGRIGKVIRALILGIPNVGKSSFINRVSKKNSLKVGNKPGVTVKNQWIRLNQNIELLDTPGVLWPKFENDDVALNLAFTGTIKDEILDKEEIAFYLTKFLLKNYLNNLCLKYKLNKEQIEDLLNTEEDKNQTILEIMNMIGKTRGCYVSRTEK